MKRSLICIILIFSSLLTSCTIWRGSVTISGGSSGGLLPPSLLSPETFGNDKKYSDNGLEFTLSADGSYTLTGMGTCTDKDITVPAKVNGIPVSAIASGAFENAGFLESITLPSTLSEISDSMFENCPNLKYNEYEGIKYLGSEKDPYEYLISAIKKTGDLYTIHPDCRVIGNSAFSGCDSLRSIHLPSSLESIGSNAFSRCSRLSNVSFSNGLISIGSYAFSSCAMTSLDLPDTLTEIESGAFWNCASLTDVSLPDSIEVIYSDCFDNTVNTKEYMGAQYLGNKNNPYLCLLYADGVSLYHDSYSSIGSVIMPGISNGKICFLNSDTKTIARNALQKLDSVYENISFLSSSSYIIPSDHMKYLTVSSNCVIEKETGRLIAGTAGAVIPDDGSVTCIGAYAFAGSGLTSISIPSSVTVIEESAFFYASALQEVTLSEGLTEIGDNAFEWCPNLYINEGFPSSLTVIGNRAFYNCINLNNITLPEGLRTMGSYAFAGCHITSELIIPASVTYIPEACFASTQITSLVIKGAQRIGTGAFSTCLELSEVSLPDTLLSIKDYAFSECLNLAQINIPASVTEIGKEAFALCKSLKSINIPKNLRTFGTRAFWSCASLTCLSIPAACTELAKDELSECTSLETLIIPSGITYIGTGCFSYCESLKTVYFAGTQNEWNAINKAKNWTYGCPEFKLVFTDGEEIIPKDTNIQIYID